MQVASFGILCCYPFCVTCHILLDTMKFSFHCSLYLYVCGCGCGSTIYVFCIFNSNCSECIRVLCIAPVCSFSNVLSTLGQCSSKFWSFFFYLLLFLFQCIALQFCLYSYFELARLAPKWNHHHIGLFLLYSVCICTVETPLSDSKHIQGVSDDQN